MSKTITLTTSQIENLRTATYRSTGMVDRPRGGYKKLFDNGLATPLPQHFTSFVNAEAEITDLGVMVAENMTRFDSKTGRRVLDTSRVAKRHGGTPFEHNGVRYQVEAL